MIISLYPRRVLRLRAGRRRAEQDWGPHVETTQYYYLLVLLILVLYY